MLQSLILISLITLIVSQTWTEQSEGVYSKREGLMGVSHKDYMYISGGRGSFGVGFANDVWRSKDGKKWEQLENVPIQRRSYHMMLELNDCMYIMGGQTFTTFYNDVWQSCDEGATWTEIVKQAPWRTRAGLAGVVHNGEMFIAGGCYNGKFFNRQFIGDVWSSKDGVNWVQRSNNTEWIARSGARLISYQDNLYVIAGERGFTPDTQYNDIWRSDDNGVSWQLIRDNPEFSKRSGHGVVVFNKKLYLIAGWPELHDMYTSEDAYKWNLISNSTWNCESSDCGKFDFWPIVHNNKIYTLGGSGAYSTFGKLYDQTWVYTENQSQKEFLSLEQI